MSDTDKLRQVIETNFRLNALQTRELSAQVNTQLSEVNVGLKVLGAKVENLGQTIQSSMNQQLDRDQETLSALRQILDNSVDLHKTNADHERRIRKLEEKTS